MAIIVRPTVGSRDFRAGSAKRKKKLDEREGHGGIMASEREVPQRAGLPHLATSITMLAESSES
jgi:hypothetical protein